MGESHRTRHRKNIPIRYCLAAVLLLLVFASSKVSGQGIQPGFALGVALPSLGDYGRRRRPGPLAQLSVLFGDSTRRVRLRIEAEGAWFPGRAPANPPFSTDGDMRILSAFANLVMAPRWSGLRPYFLLGAGAQRVTVPGVANPYGAVPGVRTGFGFEDKVRGWTLRGEVSANAVLSDFATGREYRPGTYWPITLGIQF